MFGWVDASEDGLVSRLLWYNETSRRGWGSSVMTKYVDVVGVRQVLQAKGAIQGIMAEDPPLDYGGNTVKSKCVVHTYRK